jgi:hypothetical protein
MAESLPQIWGITLHGGNDNVKIRLNIVRVAKLFPEILETIIPGVHKSVRNLRHNIVQGVLTVSKLGQMIAGMHKSVPNLGHINEIPKWSVLNLGQ